MRFALAVAASIFLAASSAEAQMHKDMHEYPCQWVHGRYGLYLGSGVRRIWIIGTRRIVHMWDEDETPLPSALLRFRDEREPGAFLYGDCKICPLEPDQAGVSRHIRIRDARRLIYKGKPFR